MAGIKLGQTRENYYLDITIMELVNTKLNTVYQYHWIQGLCPLSRILNN
jgi:hypothetical protein